MLNLVQSAEAFAGAALLFFAFGCFLALFLIEELVEMILYRFDVFRVMLQMLSFTAAFDRMRMQFLACMVSMEMLVALFRMNLGRVNQRMAVCLMLLALALMDGVKGAVTMRMNLHMVAVALFMLRLAAGVVFLASGLRVHGGCFVIVAITIPVA